MAKKITKHVSKANKVTPVAKAVVKDVAKVRKPRVISFTVVTVNKKRVFTPVNKRAKAVAAIAGTEKLTTKHLKAAKVLGFRMVEGSSLNPIAL